MNGLPAGIPPEVVAAIVAALSAYIEEPFVVTGIRPETAPAAAPPSSWAKAGLVESHLMRRQFGVRTR